MSASHLPPASLSCTGGKSTPCFSYIGFDVYDNLESAITITIASVPSGNCAWSTLIKIPPVDCRRGCWSTSHVKGSKAGKHFAAQ